MQPSIPLCSTTRLFLGTLGKLLPHQEAHRAGKNPARGYWETQLQRRGWSLHAGSSCVPRQAFTLRWCECGSCSSSVWILAGSLYPHLLHSNLQDHVHTELSPWQCLAPPLASLTVGTPGFLGPKAWASPQLPSHQQRLPGHNLIPPPPNSVELLMQFSETSNNKLKSKHIQNFFYIWVTMKTVARQPRYSSCPRRRDVNRSLHPVPYQVGDQYCSLTPPTAIDLIPMTVHQNDQ